MLECEEVSFEDRFINGKKNKDGFLFYAKIYQKRKSS
jgi:hypothetical protein